MTSALFDVFSRELVFALDICEQAAGIAMKYFRSGGLEAATKDDGTPVTAADQECERLIRQAIESKYPQDAILGEEEGEKPGAQGELAGQAPTQPSGSARSARRWIIDPIDGTYGYARGVPIWATLLALEEDGQIILGIVSAPALQELFWAEKGRGAFKNGKRISVSGIEELGKAQFNFGGLNRVLRDGYWPGFTHIVEVTCRQRGLGDYLSFTQVFEGKAEANLEIGVKPWDLAPMKIICEEAGGRFSDLDGGESIYTGSCLVTNGRLHDQFLRHLLAK